MEPYIEEDFFGTTMYWNELPIEEYKGLIERAGLHILLTGILGHGYQSDEGHKPEKHPYVLARKAYAPNSVAGRLAARHWFGKQRSYEATDGRVNRHYLLGTRVYRGKGFQCVIQET